MWPLWHNDYGCWVLNYGYLMHGICLNCKSLQDSDLD
jgi:hypothetical protein